MVKIEVKGRISGADNFVITRNEVLTAKNLGDDYRLALVEVSPDGPEHDRVRYLKRPFDDGMGVDFKTDKFVQNWAKTWAAGEDPR